MGQIRIEHTPCAHVKVQLIVVYVADKIPIVIARLSYRLLCTQDPSNMWTDVQPPPQVVDTSAVNSAGDEPRYSVRYVFDDDERTDGQPRKPTLEPGTTYVARLRARNTHGWSEWSADVVTVMYPGTYIRHYCCCRRALGKYGK